MYCIHCGEECSDQAKYCPNCGKLLEIKNICPNCGKELVPNMKYCVECGLRVQTDNNSFTKEENQQVHKNYSPDQTTKVQKSTVTYKTGKLMEFDVSWYEGEKKVGVAKATGKLTLYSDRLELKKIFGSNGAMAFGALGMALSAKSNAGKVVRFDISDIVQVKEMKYMGMMPSFVIVMRSGESHTFAGMASSSSIHKCAEIIRKSIQ